MEKGLKIVGLTMENIKKVVAVHIVPKGNVVQLTGNNAQGKSSVLDAIAWAFEGLAKIQGRPIRMGQDKGWIEIDLEKYIVKRTFKLKKDSATEWDSVLTVIGKDGAEFKQPQTMMDELFGSLSFDPLKFSRASKKEQLAMMEGLVPDFDFNKSRQDEQEKYDKRTVVNRQAKEHSLTHMSFKDVPVPEPEKVDVKALTDRLAAAAKTNSDIEKTRAERNRQKEHIETNRTSTAKLRLAAESEFTAAEVVFEAAKKAYEIAKAKIAQEQASDKQNNLDADEDEKKYLALPPLPALEEVDSITKELSTAQAKNELHEKWTKRAQAKQAITDCEKQAEGLTAEIEAIIKKRFAAVTGAGIPVEGLGFDAEGVTLNSVPFEQASDAEQLRASIAIAMASNPTLRVVRVRDGSLLDENGMKLLEEMATAADCQVWIERVGSGAVGFELVDGSLKQ